MLWTSQLPGYIMEPIGKTNKCQKRPKAAYMYIFKGNCRAEENVLRSRKGLKAFETVIRYLSPFKIEIHISLETSV